MKGRTLYFLCVLNLCLLLLMAFRLETGQPQSAKAQTPDLQTSRVSIAAGSDRVLYVLKRDTIYAYALVPDKTVADWKDAKWRFMPLASMKAP
jgi:hypothetical protein